MRKGLRFRRFMASATVFSILVFALWGCGSQTQQSSSQPSGSSSTSGSSSGSSAAAKPAAPKDPVTITVAQGVDSESGDPANQSATPSINIGFVMFDRLVERDADNKIVPGLATSWKLVNDTTWEFKLQQNVKFHDGSAFTADDVVFTFTRLLDTSKKFRSTSNVSMIKEAKKVDAGTVHLITNAPYAPLLSRLLFAPIVPKAYAEKVGDEEFSRKPIGSGPFKFVSWVKDSAITLDRYNEYWRGPAAADKLIFKTIKEDSARLAALKTGEADIIVNVPPDLIPELKNDPKVALAPVRSVRTMFVGMNVFTPPLDNVKVRQALNYAVDKQTLIKDLLGGQAFFHGRMYGPAIHGWSEGPGWPYDPAKAKQLLAEAGYPNGLTLEFEGPRGRYLMDAQLAEAIAGQLEKVGVKTKMSINDWGTFWPKTVGGNQKHLWFLGLGNTLMDADYYFNLYLSSKGRGYFHSAETDKRIWAQASIMDDAKRLTEIQSLTKELEQMAPWIFLWDQADLYAKRADIVGWEPRSDERIDVYKTTRK